MVQYPQVGTKLPGSRGTYEVMAVLGSGEFGAVYECMGPFDQIYAVKMVRPSNRPYSEVHAEWAKEVQRLFSLRHPNVVYIYDSFAHDHLFYLALERCDHALKIMLGTPMQEGLVLEMSRQLLAAVQFLHDNDVVHDDLHAGNVLITHTDRPTVKISDFGISNELRGMAAVRPNIVHHAIMAPEILATGYTSRQSDLYQVGLLLYWMLTGESAIEMERSLPGARSSGLRGRATTAGRAARYSARPPHRQDAATPRGLPLLERPRGLGRSPRASRLEAAPSLPGEIIPNATLPKTLGRFEVGAKIGGGGMATVYLGRDIRDDGTESARRAEGHPRRARARRAVHGDVRRRGEDPRAPLAPERHPDARVRRHRRASLHRDGAPHRPDRRRRLGRARRR